jgi:methionine synthase II (cobalamin-independent)
MEWKPCGAATLVGSMPHKNRQDVISFILNHLTEVPLWPQLPVYPYEQMMNQYLEGLPGYDAETMGKNIINTNVPNFENELYSFYSEYLDVIEGRIDVRESRFRMGEEAGKTFQVFLDTLASSSNAPYQAVKGQVVGPFTLLSSLKSFDGKLLLYDDRMVDVVPKHLALKALWQIKLLKPFSQRMIIFFDEPALAGFGSSAFIGISSEYIEKLLGEICDILAPYGILIGVHVCANTDWSLLLRSKINIINCDAYNYGDRFCIYGEDIISFVNGGGIIAWGMVPTDDPKKVDQETEESLYRKLIGLLEEHFTSEIIKKILVQSMITPSCGCGTLSEPVAERVVKLTVGFLNL